MYKILKEKIKSYLRGLDHSTEKRWEFKVKQNTNVSRDNSFRYHCYHSLSLRLNEQICPCIQGEQCISVKFHVKLAKAATEPYALNDMEKCIYHGLRCLSDQQGTISNRWRFASKTILHSKKTDVDIEQIGALILKKKHQLIIWANAESEESKKKVLGRLGKNQSYGFLSG